MNMVQKIVKQLHDDNALHLKRGIHIGEADGTDILKHLAEEVVEQSAEQDDKEESADIYITFLHYLIYKGWTLEEIKNISMGKLERIFGEKACMIRSK